MKSKLMIFIIASFFSMLLSGLYLVPAAPPGEVYLKVIKVDGVWKVVDAADNSKTKVKVKKKDVITWTLVGTDAHFQFPDKLLEPVRTVDSLKNGSTNFKKDGKDLKLKIKSDAIPGTYDYSVFCMTDGVFAVGGTPPQIIVE